MSFRVYADKAKQQLVCEIGALNRTCDVYYGYGFSVDVIASAPPPAGYSAYQVVLQYDEAFNLQQQDGLLENRAPKCNLGTESKSAGQYRLSCKVIPVGSGTFTHDTGPLANVQFTCKAPNTAGQIDLVGGPGTKVSAYSQSGTGLVFLKGEPKGGKTVSDAVKINCLPEPLIPTPCPPAGPCPTKQPAPLDTDGDGCSDVQENGLNPKLGGLRSYLNPYDFYDAVGPGGGPKDKIVDLPSDILGVILRWTPGPVLAYDAAFDRGPSIGPNAWNMSAPDGRISLTVDILGVALQWQHRCT